MTIASEVISIIASWAAGVGTALFIALLAYIIITKGEDS